jgi:hypothetical protein
VAGDRLGWSDQRLPKRDTAFLAGYISHVWRMPVNGLRLRRRQRKEKTGSMYMERQVRADLRGSRERFEKKICVDIWLRFAKRDEK